MNRFAPCRQHGTVLMLMLFIIVMGALTLLANTLGQAGSQT
jgi:hypothetical protein